MRNNTKKLVLLSLTVTFALMLSFIESRIPPIVAIPGVKVGLANVAVIFALYKFGLKEAAAVSAVRVLLVSILFGTPVSFIYSITGAVLSLFVMYVFMRLTRLSTLTVSALGGVTHNVGQIMAASVILGTGVVVYYLPFLLLSGTLAGIAVGAVSAILINKVKLTDYPQDRAARSKEKNTEKGESENNEG